MNVDEKIELAVSMGETQQGGFLDDPELQALLKDPVVQAAFDEHITECDGCGRIWPREDLNYSEYSGIEGMLCFYCDEANEGD
jgi:hypothetical protein